MRRRALPTARAFERTQTRTSTDLLDPTDSLPWRSASGISTRGGPKMAKPRSMPSGAGSLRKTNQTSTPPKGEAKVSLNDDGDATVRGTGLKPGAIGPHKGYAGHGVGKK